MIDDIMEKLKEHRTKVNKARITGSAVALGGSIAALLGLAFVPATAGASLVFSIGSAVLSVSGAAAAAGAGLADVFIQKNGITNEVNEHYKKDQAKLKEVIELAKKAQLNIEEIVEANLKVPDNTKNLVVQGLTSIGSAAFIPINIYDIVDASINIKKNNESNTTMTLRKFKDQLKNEREQIKELRLNTEYA